MIDSDDDSEHDTDSDHTKVMRPTDGQVSFNCAAHYEEDGTAESDPGGILSVFGKICFGNFFI